MNSPNFLWVNLFLFCIYIWRIFWWKGNSRLLLFSFSTLSSDFYTFCWEHGCSFYCWSFKNNMSFLTGCFKNLLLSFDFQLFYSDVLVVLCFVVILIRIHRASWMYGLKSSIKFILLSLNFSTILSPENMVF